MNLLESAIGQAGGLVLSIPSALIIILTREWYAAKMSGDTDAQPFAEFPLISFASLALNGAAPGGLLTNKPYALLRFLHGQLWLTILLGVAILYVLIKGPHGDTFAARFSAVFLTQVWAMLIFNFIPLPPFDAAASYFSPYMQWKTFNALVSFLSVIALVLFTYSFWRVDFLTGNFWVRWLGLG